MRLLLVVLPLLLGSLVSHGGRSLHGVSLLTRSNLEGGTADEQFIQITQDGLVFKWAWILTPAEFEELAELAQSATATIFLEEPEPLKREGAHHLELTVDWGNLDFKWSATYDDVSELDASILPLLGAIQGHALNARSDVGMRAGPPVIREGIVVDFSSFESAVLRASFVNNLDHPIQVIYSQWNPAETASGLAVFSPFHLERETDEGWISASFECGTRRSDYPCFSPGRRLEAAVFFRPLTPGRYRVVCGSSGPHRTLQKWVSEPFEYGDAK